MGNSSSVYQRGMSTAGSRYQAFGNTSSTRPYSDYRYQQLGSGRPTSTYSRYAGAGLGFYTHNSQAGNRGHGRSVYIGRERLAEQFPYTFPMLKITVSALGKVIIAECGNEGQHPYLSEERKTTLKFLRAAISFVPLAMDAGADMCNASFLFAQPGQEFAIVAGNGNWEFFFYPDCNGDISGHCVRKPWLRYIWDKVKSTVRSVGSFLVPILGPPLLALAAA